MMRRQRRRDRLILIRQQQLQERDHPLSREHCRLLGKHWKSYQRTPFLVVPYRLYLVSRIRYMLRIKEDLLGSLL